MFYCLHSSTTQLSISNSGPGSIHNDYDCLLPNSSRPASHGGLTPQSAPISNPDSYLYIPNAGTCAFTMGVDTCGVVLTHDLKLPLQVNVFIN